MHEKRKAKQFNISARGRWNEEGRSGEITEAVAVAKGTMIAEKREQKEQGGTIVFQLNR